jgi:hypothetical protein
MKLKLPDGYYTLRTINSNPKQIKKLYGMEWEKVNVTRVITDGAGCYPWVETFVILPRRSIGGAPLFWSKAYKRRVWLVWGDGFHLEPEVQYATVFDLIGMDYDD